MDAESKLAEKIAVASNNGSTSGEPADPAVLKEKVADELKSAATLKGGGDGAAGEVPLEKDDLLERLDKIETCPDAVKASSSTTNDVDMENDDLIQRLEAMEKGEEESGPAASSSEKNKKGDVTAAETNHQNGLEKTNEAESSSGDDKQDEKKVDEEAEQKMEVDGAEKKEDVSSSDSAVVEPTSNGSSNHDSEEQPSSSVKRRHSVDEEAEAAEPSSKKVHVAEETDSGKEAEVPEKKPEEKEEQKLEEPVAEKEQSDEVDKVAVQEESLKTEKADEAVEKEDSAKVDDVSKPEPEVSEEKPKEEEKKTEVDKQEPKEDEQKQKEEEQSPLKDSAPPPEPDPVTDSTKEEAKEDTKSEAVKESESSSDAIEEKESSMAVDKVAEESDSKKDEDKTTEPKAEEEPTPATVESSTTDPEPKPVVGDDTPKEDKESKSAEEEPMSTDEESKPSEEKTKTVEEESKPEKKASVVPEEKTVEAPASVEAADAEKKEEDKVEETKESSETKVTEEHKKSETKPAVEEPSASEAVEDVPKTTEEKEETKPEPSTEQTKPEAESKSKELPDTEPNPESESQEEQPTSSSPAAEAKTDDAISSSSEPKEEPLPSSTEAVAKEAPEPVEKAETVTSSDEKPSAEAAPDQAVDSTPDVKNSAPSAAPEVEEAMEVDSEPVVEGSSKADVSETPCTKKETYECTEQEKEKEPEKPTPETEAAAVPEPASAPVPEPEPAQKAAADKGEQMEVDSAAPTQSKSDGDVTESMNTTSEELLETLAKDDTATVADSQSETTATVSAHNKNLDATDGTENESKVEPSKTLDDSIESSMPTSSSDKLADRLKQRLDLISNGSSTPNAAVSSSNVYNSTPIQKQFEISSENVSKISRHSVDNSHQEGDEHSAIVADNSVVEEKEAAVASTSGVSTAAPEAKKEAAETSKQSSSVAKDESSLKTESSEVDSCSASSALNTADEINMYASNARKFNGISSTSGSEMDEKSGVLPASITTTAATTTTVNKLDLTPALTSEEALYEVSVWFDGTELQFLSVEKVEHKLGSGAAGSATAGSTQDLTGNDSSKQSSNGSVGSLGPFSLPHARPTADSAMSQSSTTESSSGTIQLKQSLPKMKHTVRGAKALASLMIEEFTKIKRALSKDDELSDTEPEKPSSMKTPKSQPPSSAKKTPAGRGQKRTHTDSDAAEDEEPKTKQPAKQAKKSSKTDASSPETSEATETAAKQDSDDPVCLARWSDRKYYAGKVTGYKGDNKYMILFEDGASKALSKDVIVFGEKDTLPIVGHSVHALTGGDTYEPGIVQKLTRNDANEVVYAVLIGDGTIEVTASDMYLTEEQARFINKACNATEEKTTAAMQSPQSSGGGKRGSAANTPVMQTPDEKSAPSAEKGSRSTRSKRGAEKPQTPVTPEAGYSGGVGKKGRRGRSKAQQALGQATTISESSDVSDTVEEDIPPPASPECGLEAVDGVQPELQITEKESEIKKMYLVAEYLGAGSARGLEELLGPLPGSKTLFRNKHFILTCTIPPKGICSTPDKDNMKNKYRKFSGTPFVKEHLRRQIEVGGGKVYQHFEDIPKAKYKQCKLIAPHPSATAKYVQCLAVDIAAVSHEWIIECCQTLTFLDYKPYALPSGWSLIDERYIRWNCGRGSDQRSTVNPFLGCCINIASMNNDFTEFWSRVCKMAGATIRLIKCETDLTENLTGYMLTDQEFPEEIKLRATRYGLLIVSTVWVLQNLIVGRVCPPDSHEKLTQIYQDDDY